MLPLQAEHSIREARSGVISTSGSSYSEYCIYSTERHGIGKSRTKSSCTQEATALSSRQSQSSSRLQPCYSGNTYLYPSSSSSLSSPPTSLRPCPRLDILLPTSPNITHSPPVILRSCYPAAKNICAIQSSTARVNATSQLLDLRQRGHAGRPQRSKAIAQEEAEKGKQATDYR